jgi:transaldolase
MKFFIDTTRLSDFDDIRDAGILDGVTINLNDLKREGVIDEVVIQQFYQECSAITSGDICISVIGTDFADLLAEGEWLAGWGPNLVVGLTMSRTGIRVIRQLSERGVRTCAVVHTTGQAILAARAGASYVSVPVGEIDKLNRNGIAMIEQIAEIFAIQGLESELMAGAMRNAGQIIAVAQAGADVVACSPELFTALLEPPSDIGLE